MNPNQTAVYPYLAFNGNCREAMTFYKDCIGGELEIMDFASAPMDTPPEAKNNVMHSRLTKGELTIMASDSMPGQTVTNGSSVALSVNCASKEEVDTFFNNLSKDGNVTMPAGDTFWGAYFGMLTDKFGIHWMFNYDRPQQ